MHGVSSVTVSRLREERTVTTADGIPLFVRRVSPSTEPWCACLLVHGFIQNSMTFDLPSMSVLELLADKGIDAWAVDLRGHGSSYIPSDAFPKGIEESLEHDVPTVLEAIRRERPETPLFIIGHSLGAFTAAVLMGMASDLVLRHVRGAISIAPPFLLSEGSPGVTLLSRSLALLKHIPGEDTVRSLLPSVDVRPITRQLERPGSALALKTMMRPLNPFNLDNIRRNVMAEWAELSFGREGIGVVIQLIKWVSRGHPISTDEEVSYLDVLAKVTRPILVVAGTEDRLAPVTSVRPGFEAIGSGDKTILIPERPYGHCDLLVGKHALQEIWSPTVAWMRARA